MDLPSNKTITGCKWVYKVKYESNGSIKSFKPRVIPKNYNQKRGLITKVSSHRVAKMVTLEPF